MEGEELFSKPYKNWGDLFKNPLSRDMFRFIKVSDFTVKGGYETRVGTSYRLKKGEIHTPNYLEYISSATFEGEIVLYPEYLENYLQCRRKADAQIKLNGKLLLKALRKLFGNVYIKEKNS